MNIEDKYLNERVFGLDTSDLSLQARKAIQSLEKAIATNSPHLSKVAASVLQIVYNEGFEQGEKNKG
jgi:hypothetical protein